ncbi:SRPBCC family protein [Saccharopolyspora phatthalungensis]|uniref:Coenzyme Q-binding protein COQ10 START domain-containing protein n=1 Tax=Saccharopolyspora phatthalungensis TaxID=664693 RepID=A0A840Q6Q2_9PSEU|nr:SRPBCC family protein [Saccharopolyspora phatthalungensis]MBB5152503.1 hypothetical protein [Saccharopolyspora phatthalungensis]
MRHVELQIIFEREQLSDVFDAILRREPPNPDGGSSWEWSSAASPPPPQITSGVRPRWLEFRTGTLRWNEEISSVRPESRIRFTLTDGDFAEFSGAWTLSQVGDDVSVAFEADFDFGLPSMAGILDPIAETAIKETISRAVAGMLPRVRVVHEPQMA